MKIDGTKITKWRHFDSVILTLPGSSPVICLVGGNGTGKSQILELIAACAQRIGLSAGTESVRGDPFSEGDTFEIKFLISPNTIPALEIQALPHGLDSHRHTWDRTLTVQSAPSNATQITAGGVPLEAAHAFAATVVDGIRQSAAIHYLFDLRSAYQILCAGARRAITDGYDYPFINGGFGGSNPIVKCSPE